MNMKRGEQYIATINEASNFAIIMGLLLIYYMVHTMMKWFNSKIKDHRFV